MNVDAILRELNAHRVRYLLIGGMNFLLRHRPIVTFDVDLWIEDTEANLGHCERALASLNASWGLSEDEWGPVAALRPGWLSRRPVFCMTSAFGAIDIFRAVVGLDDWAKCFARAVRSKTAGGVSCRGLSDVDMLRSQMALEPRARDAARIAVLKAAGRRRRT